jgi:hypothetical protein
MQPRTIEAFLKKPNPNKYKIYSQVLNIVEYADTLKEARELFWDIHNGENGFPQDTTVRGIDTDLDPKQDGYYFQVGWNRSYIT